MRVCLRCYVSGRVQGVWFRGSTRQQAERLGLSGYAKNLPDGRVEVLACGKKESLEMLNKWLWQGPSAASVSDVVCSEVDAPVQLPQGFTTA